MSARQSPRPLPAFTVDTEYPSYGFVYRGLELNTYRPAGFADGVKVTYGWSVFEDTGPDTRREITGGWGRRADAVRAAMRDLDGEGAARNAAGGCCVHGEERHAPGRYTRTRCTVRGCGCVMFG